MSVTERKIICLIFLRKMKDPLIKKKVFSLSMAEKIALKFADFKSIKRFEENFKMIYKFSMEKFKSEILATTESSKKEDDEYYAYFFKEAAKRLNLPIKEFLDPTNPRKKNCKYHLMNMDYLALIL